MSNFPPADFIVPRPISSKRSATRDPANRKSVSFNDTPIVHEVPSHDHTRTATTTATAMETCRSWIFTDVTQKFTSMRLHDGPTPKPIEDERTKLAPSISPLSIASSLASDERKSSDMEPFRHPQPFHYLGPVSESTATYTNILSTSLIAPGSNEPLVHSRSSRVRSANLPLNSTTFRPMESISITPLRSSRLTLRPNPKASRQVSPRPMRVAAVVSPRSRSAHVVSSSSSTRKRSPNVRQSYGSYYMHRLLLPTTIN